MSEHDHPLEWLPELALGLLTEPQAANVREHAAGCEACRAELQEMERVARLLPLAAEDRAPSPAVREGVFARIAAEPKVLRPEPARWERWRWAGAIAAGAALLLAAGALTGAGLAGDDEAGDSTRSVALLEAAARGTLESARAEQGGTQVMVIAAPGGRDAFALLEGLPPLPAGKAYQAWFTRDGVTMEPSTVFRAEGRVWLEAGAPVREFAGLGFTIEDEDGADQPSQAPFVVVSLGMAARRPAR